MYQLYQVQKIVLLIENNFDNEITQSELEKISNYSYRNIQRIFKSIFGENIKSFQRRLRLERAYKRIVYTKDCITDIAIQVGYSNLQAFSKAFFKQFHISPSEARIDKKKIFEAFIANTTMDLNVEKIYMEQQLLYCKTIKTENYDNAKINKLWREIDFCNQKLRPYESYGIIVDQPLITEHKNCIYEFAIDKIPEQSVGFISKKIFGKKYLRFIHYGTHDNIEETYKNFYKFWLSSPNLELDHSPVIEHYLISDKEEEKEENYITHIYFPLKN